VATLTTSQRQTLAKAGIAMPDGSYYIRNAAELSDAIKAVGRATPNAGESDLQRRNAVRRHCVKRAKALKLDNMIPSTWNSDGSLKQSDMIGDFIAHFGVKGMKWGVRKDRGGSSSHPVSEDAAKARASSAVVRKHGTSALSNAELQHLVNRMQLEQQHGRLSTSDVSLGKKIAGELLSVGGNVAKQQATMYASKYAAKGIEHLIKKGATGK
jgi:hypothetical protein